MICLRVTPEVLRILLKISVATSIFVGGAVELSDDDAIAVCLVSLKGALFDSSFALGKSGVVLVKAIDVGFCDPFFSVVMMDSNV